MNCPFCGAAEFCDGSYSYKFECGSTGVSMQNLKRSKICRELCQLREKNAQGLEWEATGGDHEAASPSGSFVICMYPSHYRLIVNGTPEQRFKTLDAAKAHAEELHQKAWRELRARWDFKRGGK